MNRAAIILLLFLAITLTFAGQALSTFGVWLINRAAALINYTKDIKP